MFDIAWSELLLIAVIALIFIGPKELPQVLHTFGRAVAKLRRSADDFRRQFEDSVREAGYEDLHKNLQDFRSLNPGTQLKDTIARAINQAEYAASKPVLAPQPAEPQPQPTPDKPALDGTKEGSQQSGPAAGEQPESAASPHLEMPATEPGIAEALPSAAAEPQRPAAEMAKDRIAPAA